MRIGPTSISTHCFFGLGWRWNDYRYMQAKHKPVLMLSECLTRLSRYLPPMVHVADSDFCTTRKIGSDTLGNATRGNARGNRKRPSDIRRNRRPELTHPSRHRPVTTADLARVGTRFGRSDTTLARAS